jgi:hypothetical protein
MPTTDKSDRALRAPCALFVEDVGGWWKFLGIHVDREEGIRILELHKHGPHARNIVALELPNGHKIYEWVRGA